MRLFHLFSKKMLKQKIPPPPHSSLLSKIMLMTFSPHMEGYAGVNDQICLANLNMRLFNLFSKKMLKQKIPPSPSSLSSKIMLMTLCMLTSLKLSIYEYKICLAKFKMRTFSKFTYTKNAKTVIQYMLKKI